MKVELSEKHVEGILKLRELSLQPELRNLFLRCIVEVREELYQYIENNGKYKHEAYILSIVFPFVIDYIFCCRNKLDTYKIECMIKLYGVSIQNIINDKLFDLISGKINWIN